MIAGASLFTLSSLAYLWAPPFWPFFLVRVVQGVGLALFHTASFTFIANISPKAHRGQSLSYFFLAPNVSLAVLPSLGMFMIDHFSFTSFFLACFGMSFCSLLITFGLGRRHVVPPEESSPENGSLLNWKALPPSVVSFLNFILWGAITAFLPLYALEHGVSNSALFFTAIAVMFFLGRAFGGKIVDLYGGKRVIPPLLAASVISVTLLAVSGSLPMFIFAGLIWGAGNALLTPSVLSCVLDVAGSSKGSAIGMYMLLSDFGLGLGPVIMGIVIRLSSYPTMFFCLAFTGIINLVFFYVFVRKRNFLSESASVT
jgi:MFS family permease